MDNIVMASPLIGEYDINKSEDSDRIIEILRDKAPESREWWAFWTGMFLANSRNALSAGDIKGAVWARACAERCRWMLIFKEQLEVPLWMGQSVRRLVHVLNLWDANKDNDEEAFWQTLFSENSYVLSQVFAVPVLFIQERAYVGGMKLDRTEGRFVDYLLAAESSQEAILVEIKTPATKLLGTEYRNQIYVPSKELTGAVSQVLHYRNELVRNLKSLVESNDSLSKLTTFSPKCIVLAGNMTADLNLAMRRSFELYRGSLSGVEIITYGELFRKIEVLAELFSLKRNVSTSTSLPK